MSSGRNDARGRGFLSCPTCLSVILGGMSGMHGLTGCADQSVMLRSGHANLLITRTSGQGGRSDARGHNSEVLEALWQSKNTAEQEAFVEGINGLYDEQLPALDRAIHHLLQEMDERRLLERTLVVLTADHGEMLGDRETGDFGHGDYLWPELVQIPFLWMGPGISPGQKDCLGQSIDIGPSLLAMAGLPEMAGVDGQDLQAGCRTVSRHSIYSPLNVSIIAASTQSLELQWTCQAKLLQAWDLTTQPPTLVNEPLLLPEGSMLLEELNGLVDDIQEARPETHCAAPTG